MAAERKVDSLMVRMAGVHKKMGELSHLYMKNKCQSDGSSSPIPAQMLALCEKYIMLGGERGTKAMTQAYVDLERIAGGAVISVCPDLKNVIKGFVASQRGGSRRKSRRTRRTRRKTRRTRRKSRRQSRRQSRRKTRRQSRKRTRRKSRRQSRKQELMDE